MTGGLNKMAKVNKITVTGRKLASTKPALEWYLAFYKEHHPCDRQSVGTEMFYKYISQLPEYLFFEQRQRIFNNVSRRLSCAFMVLHPETMMHEWHQKSGLLSIDDFIDVIEYAIKMDKSLCDDQPVNK